MPDLFDDDEPRWLTYREAAKRVGRKHRAIRYWRARGMPMTWEVRDGQRVRVVEETILLKWWRERLKNDPVHQNRIRAQFARQNATQHPTRPHDQPTNEGEKHEHHTRRSPQADR